LLMKR